MKRSFENTVWDFLMHDVPSYLVTIAIWVVFTIGVLGLLRLMAWADTGSKGEAPVERSIIPEL